MESGQLQLRGADPFALANPTRITGTNTDGTLSGVELATPTVTTTRDVPTYTTTVTIDAAFSMVSPGTGTINEQGGMTVQVRLAVDLHLAVPILPGDHLCRAASINLTLTSTAPYDPETQRVTLRAPNFTVPPVVASPACNGLLVDPVNEALAGAGHSLTLNLAGGITIPPEGEPTATSLAVAPAGSSRFGDEVTLTAAVTPDPAVPGAPPVTGVVDFLDRGISVGTADVGDDGVATFTTTDLAAGPRQLQAVYSGAPPDWDPSTSAVVPYTVIADPAIVTTVAGEVRVGGSKDFDLTVVNTGFGADLEDARVEVTIRRQAGGRPIGPDGVTPRLTLSRVADGTATPITLTHLASPFPARLTGTVGDAGTWNIARGAEHTETLRLTVADGVDVGPLGLTFALVSGTGGDAVQLGTTTGSVTMVDEARQDTTITAGDPGFPDWGIPAIPPVTPVVRQGNVAEVGYLKVAPVVAEVAPTGTLTFSVDGVAVVGLHNNPSGGPDPYTWLETVPLVAAATGSNYLIKVPATLPAGTRVVTVRYSGDALYAPSQVSFPITVEPSIGTVYECAGVGVGSQTVPFAANIEVQATLPSVWPAGRELSVDRVQVRMRLSRTGYQRNLLSDINDPASQRDWRLELGPEGMITPSAVSSANEEPMSDDTHVVDRLIDLTGGAGAISVSATPGEPVAYTLDTINISGVLIGFGSGFRCTPDAAPYTVGTVTPAGTTLAVEPGDVAAEGSDVALTATALPVASGAVEFRDGTETIGVVPVDSSGVARMATRDLPVGTRSLTARFFGGLVATSPSVPVELRVASCGAASEPGNGAVVRLVYLELLGRCPDAAGYSYWVGRLDGGTSREAFARSIARTPEAVGRVVDDAYQAVLGRAADAAGRAFWTRRLQANGRYDQLLADLAASGEFWSKAGSSNGGAVTRIYERLIGRSPDQSGFDYWVGRLDSGVSRRALVVALANQSEPLGVLVDDAYDEILDRKATAAERTEGIAHLRSTGDRSGLYAKLIGTQEFHDRAQGLPDPA